MSSKTIAEYVLTENVRVKPSNRRLTFIKVRKTISENHQPNAHTALGPNVLITDECHCTLLKSQRTICKPQTVAHLKKCPVVLVHVHLVVRN